MKEKSNYDDYKFLSREELQSLNLTHLIGTNLLRGFMHGFFIDVRLYNKLKSALNPFKYEEYQQKKIEDKLNEKIQSRLRVKKSSKIPEVNPDLAKRTVCRYSI